MTSTEMELLNSVDGTLEVIRYLAEIGPALDRADAHYLPHALTLLGVIASYAAEAERTMHNLAAQLRALEENRS